MVFLNDADKKHARLLLSILTVTTLVVFAQVLQHEFVSYDDPEFVAANPHIRQGLTIEGILWAFTTAHELNWIPLTWLSHMLDVQLFGMNPAGHHAMNLLLHTATTILISLVFTRMTGAPWRSAAVAMLFAFHPLHVESVAWIAERKDVLSAFFWMMTLYAYVRYTEKPGPAGYSLVLVSFVLGLLSKPMLVTLPLVLLLLDWWPLGRFPAQVPDGEEAVQRASVWRLIGEKAPFVILSIGVGIITYLSQRSDITNVHSYQERTARALTSYIAYLAKTVWPLDLAVIYPFVPEPPTAAQTGMSLGLFAVLTGGAIVLRRRKPYLIAGWLWYSISLLPVIGLVQIGHHSIADRYTYIPLIGIFAAVVWGVSDVLMFGGSRLIVLKVLAGAVLAAMIVLTSLQLRYWKNSESLFRHAVEVTQNNWIAHNNLGQALLGQGRTDEAISHFRAAAAASPSSAMAYLNLGIAYQEKSDLSRAIEAFGQALERDASCHPAHVGLGRSYLNMGKRDLAWREYEQLYLAGSNHAPELRAAIAEYDAARAGTH